MYIPLSFDNEVLCALLTLWLSGSDNNQDHGGQLRQLISGPCLSVRSLLRLGSRRVVSCRGCQGFAPKS